MTVSDTAFPWMDLNSDAAVNTQDALLFADLITLVDSDPGLHCTWLESVYHPSTATVPHQVIRGNGFTDASVAAHTSAAWQAVDPKLIYLRSNASDVMYPAGVDCVAAGSGVLQAGEVVPELRRFDGSAPLTEAEFRAVVPGAAEVDLFRAFMRPDEARDWRMFMVRCLLLVWLKCACMCSGTARVQCLSVWRCVWRSSHLLAPTLIVPLDCYTHQPLLHSNATPDLQRFRRACWKVSVRSIATPSDSALLCRHAVFW